MAEQSILDLALIDFSKLEPDSQKLINILTNVFDTAEKFKTVFPIQVGVDSSWKELTQKQDEFKKGVEDISLSEMKAQKVSIELAKSKLQQSLLEQKVQNEQLKGLELEEKANQRITKSLKDKAAASEQAAKAADTGNANIPFEIKSNPDPEASSETIAAAEAERAAIVEAQLAATEWAQTQEVLAAANGELDNSLLGLNAATEENVVISKEEAKINAYLANDTKQLSDAYNDASLKASNYALTLGQNHPITLEAQADARALGQILKDNDATIGKNQRSVGDYGNAFSKAFSRATDSTRVINRVVSQLSRQVISLGTGMLSFAIGAKALELLGKGIEKVFDYAFPAVDKLINATDALDTTMEKANGPIKKVIENVDQLKGNVELAKEGILKKSDVVKEYNDTMGKAAGQVKTLDEVEQKLVADGDAYIQMTIYKTAALEVLNEAATEAIKNQKDLLDDQSLIDPNNAKSKTVFGHQGATRTAAQIAADDIKLKTDEAKKQQDNYVNVYEQLMRKAASFKLNMDDAAKEDTGKLKKEFDTQGALLKIYYQKQIDYNADILKDDKQSSSTRLQALKDEFTYKEKLLAAGLASTLKVNKEEQADTLDDISRAKEGTIAYKNLQIDLKNEQGQAKVANAKYLADKIKLERDAVEAVVKFNEDGAKRIADLNAEIAEIQLKDSIKSNEDISKDESLSLADRVIAYGDAVKAKQDLIDQDFEKEKRDQGLTNLEEVKQDAEKLKKLEALQAEHDSKMHDAAIEAKKGLDEIVVSGFEEQKRQVVAGIDQDLAYNKASVIAKVTNKKEAEKQIKALDDKAAIDRIKADEDYQRKILNSSETTNQQKYKAQADLDDDFTKEQNAKTKDDEDKNKDDKKKFNSFLIDEFGKAADIIQKIGDDAYERRMQQQENLARKVEENKDKEIQAINEASISAQQRAIEIMEIEKQAAAEKKKIAQEERKIKAEQARFDRAISIAKIIEGTAVGAMQAYAELGIYGAAAAAIIVAFGAAELAEVVSQPIPSYAEGAGKKAGRPSHKGGLALYGEAGPELVEEPGRKPYIAFKPTFGHLNPGTDITPLDKFNPILKQSFMDMYREPIVDVDKLASRLLEGQEIQTQRITNALNNQKPSIVHIHDRSRQNLRIDKACRQ